MKGNLIYKSHLEAEELCRFRQIRQRRMLLLEQSPGTPEKPILLCQLFNQDRATSLVEVSFGFTLLSLCRQFCNPPLFTTFSGKPAFVEHLAFSNNDERIADDQLVVPSTSFVTPGQLDREFCNLCAGSKQIANPEHQFLRFCEEVATSKYRVFSMFEQGCLQRGTDWFVKIFHPNI